MKREDSPSSSPAGWEPPFLREPNSSTKLVSKRSSCVKAQQAALLIKDNRIISQGYNGYLPGFPHESIIKDGHEVATIHAEQNTIIDCAKRGVNCQGCEAYVTHFPCLNCLKMLVQAGIEKIYYIHAKLIYNHSQKGRILEMRNHSIWNVVQACIYKSPKSWGARDICEVNVKVGSSSTYSNQFVNHKTTKKEIFETLATRNNLSNFK